MRTRATGTGPIPVWISLAVAYESGAPVRQP
jgi:hypothetical protein